MAKFRLKFNKAVIKEYAFNKDSLSFGRKEGNDIVISHPAVSGFHGKILREGDEIIVEDLNSTNGTFVNGRKIKRSKIEDKDSIRVAKHIIEFVNTDEPVAAPPPPPEMAGTPLTLPPEEQNDLEKQKEILRKSLQEGNPPPKPAPTSAPAPSLEPVAPQPTSAAQASQAAPITPEAPTAAPTTPGEKIPKIKVVSGAADGETEWELKDLNTYIGTGPKAKIKIKGFLAPELAAAIVKRPEGFFLKAIKSGYPKVNGASIKEQALLESGATIDCGSTSMLFILSEKKKS